MIELHQIVVEALHLQLLGGAQDLWLLALGHRCLTCVHVLQQGSDLEALNARQYDAALILRHVLQYGLKVGRVGREDNAMRLELLVVDDQGAVHIAAHLVQSVQDLDQIRLMIVPAQTVRLTLVAGHGRRPTHLAAVALTVALSVAVTVAVTLTVSVTVTVTMSVTVAVTVSAMSLAVRWAKWFRLLVRGGVTAAVIGAVQAGERGAQQCGRV